MRRVSTFPVVRTVVIAIIVMLMPYTVPGAMAAIKVNCNVVGQTITAAIAANPDVSPLVLQVKGTCTENITIIRDDVTIKTNGVAHATIHAADPTQPTVLLDGARNIVIDGKVANGISVTGGTFNIDATRGSSLSIANCVVSGASNTGIISAFNSTVAVNACSITGNVTGVLAANSASLGITNSTVSGNTGTGLGAFRTSYLRVGQDLSGNPVAKPVTVSGNASHGISIVDSSSATIVAADIHDNGGHGVLFQRGSGGTVGTGTNGLVAANTIQNNTGTGVTVYQASAALIQGNTINGNARGVFVGTSSATIFGNSIQNNLGRGVQVVEKGSARIGVNDSANSAPGNTISGNTSDGIGIFDGAEGVVAGNSITSNGGHGISMNMGTMNLVGGNTISGNTFHGIFAGASRVFQAPGTYGSLPDTVDVSQNNGLAGLNLFNNASAELWRITLTNNTRQGIAAGLNSTIYLHVYDTARPNNLISITNNGTGNVANNNDGITLFSASMINSPQNPGGPGQVIITGHPGWGVNCFGTATKAAAGMDTTGISGNTAGTVNCGGF